MRTNIVLDDQLVKEAQRLSGIRTKKEVVHEALRTFIRLKQQAGVRSLRGKLHWEGDMTESRQGRVDGDR